MSEILRQSMTYGTMPTFGDFETAFDAECPRGTYAITLGSSDSRAMDGFKLGDGEWSTRPLYDACQEIVNASQVAPIGAHQSRYYEKFDAAMDLVSSIMGTLGFEWI